MKTEILKYNLFDRGRKHTGQDRSNVDVHAMIKRINDNDTQEMVNTGSLLGYYGHQIRQRFGMRPPETAMIDGQKITLEPALKTIYLKAFPDGTVEHQAEFLNNESGNFAAKQYKANIGGFSTAVSYLQNGLKLIPRFFAGFDYVFQPNYATNIGNGVLLDGLYCDAEHALFDSLENTNPLQAQLIQALDSAIVQNYDHIHQINALAQQNEHALQVIADDLAQQQQVSKQQRYAAIKAKCEQDEFDSMLGHTCSFNDALAQSNAFLTANLPKKSQDANDAINFDKLRFIL